jgi:hypothetical protein
MSHIVTVATKIGDAVAVAAACRRLGLAEPVAGKARLYSGEASGLILQLPGWRYPIVIDTASGTLSYDNFSGHWGSQDQLDHFIQAYAVELVKLEARKKGFTVSEQPLQDGSIQVQVIEGGS